MNSSHSSRARRIISAQSGSQKSRNQPSGTYKEQNNQSLLADEMDQRNSEMLPDINSARNSQMEGRNDKSEPFKKSQRASSGQHRRSDQKRSGHATPKASGSVYSKTMKSYQLADQFQADQIIEKISGRQNLNQSSRRTSGAGMRSGVGSALQSKKSDINVEAADIKIPETQLQKIDFHGTEEKKQGLGVRVTEVTVSGQNFGQELSLRTGKSAGKKVNAWENFQVNQFKVRNQEPGEIIDQLKMLTSQPIPFMGEMPPQEEMDSTDALDSFMEAFYKIVQDKSFNFTPEVRKGIHLATGVRTSFCESVLTFICHHQKLQQAFSDSVEFFMDSLTSVVRLEQENRSMKQNISQLLNLKEDGILVKYNLEKRLKEQIHNVDKITAKEQQSQNKIKQLKKQLADKFSECDSLQYRLKHYEEITSMMDPPGNINPGAIASGAVPNPTDDETKQRSADMIAQGNSVSSVNDNTKIIQLQNLNRKLEDDLQQMRESFAQKDNSEHFRKIQDMFNKIQIENKNLRIYNQKCETKLESKQNLVNHLEEKVTQVMVEKEEAIIALKAEIVLQKNKLELNEDKFNKKLEMANKKIEFNFKQKYDERIKLLEKDKMELDKQNKDLRKRLNKLHKEHEELSKEFNKFRMDKEEQEETRNHQFKSIEERMSNVQMADAQKIQHLQKTIESLENERDVVKKEKNILYLRQKYLKQQTETLAKQKIFLFETLGKGQSEIQETLYKMEKSMMADNNNQAYLVSVEKCIKQAKKMADMGTDALQNISQILQFLRIEKLHELLSNEEELEKLEKSLVHQMKEDSEEQKKFQEQLMEIKNQSSKSPLGKSDDMAATGQINPLNIQRMLNKLGIGASTPPPEDTLQPSPVMQIDEPQINQSHQMSNDNSPIGANPEGEQPPPPQPEVQNEDYFLNNCPIEMASICVKLLIDILVQLGLCQTIHDVPTQIATLLQKCNKKSDQTVEQEILDKYLTHAKQMIDQQINAFRTGSPNESPQIPEQQQQIIQDQLLNPSNVVLQENNISHREIREQIIEEASQRDFSKAGSLDLPEQSQHDERSQAEQQEKELSQKLKSQHEIDHLNLEVDKLKVQIDEHKIKSKHLQMNLAGKIVVLEEQIEQLNKEREENMVLLEKAHEEEIERITSGIDQREVQLFQLVEEYREEIRDLQFKIESSWKPAEESKTIQKMEKGTRGNLYKLMKDEYESLFRKNSELLNNYQASINEFVYLREDLRGSFTLAFDCECLDDGMLNMLNEAMLKYYLSKTFLLDKSKFRFLRSEQLFEQIPGQAGQGKSQILKLIIEVVAEDQAKVAQLFKHVKAQIKDGTSLLYDFMPLYFGMNLGSSGFSTHHNLKDFGLLSKTGQVIDGEDYVVSVLRNKEKPLIFKVIATNLELREEFMMELSESDIYELVEGDQQVLKNLEPDGLVQKITTNLNLIIRDKIKVLTCEQKIFFNDIWMKSMESGKNQQVHIRSPLETSLYPRNKTMRDASQNPAQSPLMHTAARTSQLSRLHPKFITPPGTFLDKFKNDVECQTDYGVSTLYEGFENVYRGVQKVGEITHMRLSIQESTKTKTLIFTFDDLTSLKKLKFSLYEKLQEDQYVIHSECMRISQGHHVLVTVEQIQQQGLLIKMFDMQECKSVSFSLIRKDNGQFTRLDQESSLDLLIKEDFRSFIYELTFVDDRQANQNLMQSMQYLFRDETTEQKRIQQAHKEAEQKKQLESVKRENIYKKQAVGKVLPRRKRAELVERIYSFSQRAFYKDKWTNIAQQQLLLQEGQDALESKATVVSGGRSSIGETLGPDGANLSDWRDSPGEKGQLLYRNIFIIRCIFDGGEEKAQEAVITLYLKEMVVNIEVSLHKEASKMSIASSAHAIDLFGDDPLTIPFKDRIALLDSMMEKFFVISEDAVYHMRVESEAVPVHLYLEEKKKEQQMKNQKEKQRAGDMSLFQNQQKLREIKDCKPYNDPDKAKCHVRIAMIEGEAHEVEMLFMAKDEKKSGKSGGRHVKKASTYGKSQVEIVRAQIEQFLEEQCSWDSIYFEVRAEKGEPVQAWHDRKALAEMFSRDEFFDWKSAMSNIDPLLLNYIEKSIVVDKVKNTIYLNNKENIEKNIMQKLRKLVGGKYVVREDLELSADEKKLIQKQMITNSEFEMCEFLYDIKIFQLQVKSNKDIIAYQMELFTLSEPEIVYQFTYPMIFASEIQDPHTLMIDVINLIERPFQLQDQKKKKGNMRSSQNASQQIQPGPPSSNPSGIQKENTPAQMSDVDMDNQNPLTSQKRAMDKSTFQSLFRKYIDNRIVLFVQESRFPRKLDFILAEPCSQLQWRYHVEPRMITTGIHSMHFVDQATIEQFVAVLLDENEHLMDEEPTAFEYEEPYINDNISQVDQIEYIEAQEDWTNIMEVSDSALFVDHFEIHSVDLCISIFKKRNMMNIKFNRQGDEEEDIDTMATQTNPAKGSGIKKEVLLKSLEFRVDPHAGDSILAKVIRESGLDYCMVFIQIRGKNTEIKIVKLTPTSIQTLFKFTFIDEREIGDEESEIHNYSELDSAPIFTRKDLQASVLDALRRYYGTMAMEEAMRIFEDQKQKIVIEKDQEYEEPTIFEHMDSKKESIHKSRLISKYLQSLDEREIILYRKTFFDDKHEKLIIMSVHLKFMQREFQDLVFSQDVDVFNVHLNEPESGQTTTYETALHQFLTQEEIIMEIENGNLKDLSQLKRISKKFLEERVEIRRTTEQSQEKAIEDKEQKPNAQMLGDYTFDIVFDREGRMSHMDGSLEMGSRDEINGSGVGGKQSDQMYINDHQGVDMGGMVGVNSPQFNQSMIVEEESDEAEGHKEESLQK